MRRWLLVLVLTTVAGCGDDDSDDANVNDGGGESRSDCPDSTWNNQFSVEPVEIIAGSSQIIEVLWEVYDEVELPATTTLSVGLGETDLILTMPLSETAAGFDTVFLEGSAVNPFGAALVGRTVSVVAQSERPRGCSRGAEATGLLPLQAP